jgi:hypothetical protein
VERGLPPDRNPYSLKFQALLALRLASELGLERVVLAGHGDGALLALLAAAMAVRERALGDSAPAEPGGIAWARPLPAGANEHAFPATHAVPVRGSAGGGRPARGHRRLGSVPLPDSLEVGWMSSVTDSSWGHSLLRRLLKGDWPASIEPRTALHPSPGFASQPPWPWRSPPHPQVVGSHIGGGVGAQGGVADVEPAAEQSQAASRAQAAALPHSGAPLAEMDEELGGGLAQPPCHGEACGGQRGRQGQEEEGVEAEFLGLDLPPGNVDGTGTKEPPAAEMGAGGQRQTHLPQPSPAESWGGGEAWRIPEPVGLILLHPGTHVAASIV